MREIQLSQFKKKCDSILKNVNQSNKSIAVTKDGKLLVKIVPISKIEHDSWLGCMSGTGKIMDDIISPAEDAEAWEVLKK